MSAFYDTSSLLASTESMLSAEHFFVSSITLAEIEGIKTNPNKPADIKYKARVAARYLDTHRDQFTVVVCSDAIYKRCTDRYHMPVTNDNLILTCAAETSCETFYSEDICMRIIGHDVFDLATQSAKVPSESIYTGYKRLVLDDNHLSSLYGEMDDNRFECLTNEYVIIDNPAGEFVDALRWDGSRYQQLKRTPLKSSMFGNVRPYDNDIYQQLAIDSMSNNKITMLKGPAGTGKSYLALAYLCKLLEQRKIDKIVVVCNPLAVASAARLGFYPGTRDQKILDSAPGAMLSSKFGDKFRVEQMCAEGRLVLLPMSDIRGYDTTGMNAGVYVVEAQNMDISLAKLTMQRIGEDSICIVDGDYNAQVDSNVFAGDNNGMRRISQVFRGHSVYGEVELRNVYRSEIARIAEGM